MNYNAVPGGGAPAWNLATPSALLGLSPANVTARAAGATLPPTSHTGNDNGSVPWSPDSPVFWLAAVVALTCLGVAGASVRVRAFDAHAGASIGKES